MKKRYEILLAFLILTVTAPLFLSHQATAMEIGAGATAMEEGDDRMRPGTSLHLGFNPTTFARAFLLGRSFGPVKERTTAIEVMRRFPMVAPYLNGAFGLSALQESTEVKGVDARAGKSQTFYNAGGAFGIYLETPPSSTLSCSLGWESHLYPAGIAGVFLATGRKQFISLTAGLAI